MEMTRIEINGNTYEESIIDDRNELGLFRDGALIAKTKDDYCLILMDSTIKIDDVKNWMIYCTKALHIAHTMYI